MMTESRSSYGTLPIGTDPRCVDDGGTYVWIPLEQYKAMDEKIKELEEELDRAKADLAVSEAVGNDFLAWYCKLADQYFDVFGPRLHAMRQMYRRLMEQYNVEAKKKHDAEYMSAAVTDMFVKECQRIAAANASLRAEVARLIEETKTHE